MLSSVADRGWGMHDRFDGRFHPWLGLGMMLLVAGAIVLAVWLFTRNRHVPATHGPAAPAPAAPSPTAAAEAILAERLARSEISPDDYRAMLAALREGHPA